MGCDIHGFFEVRRKESKQWEVYDRVGLGVRNYQLFWLIAGVREGQGKPVNLPKGIPKDASEIVKSEVKALGRDGHNHTWLTTKEMKRAYDEFDKIEKAGKSAWLHYGIDSVVYDIYSYNDWWLEEHPEYDDVRGIFWFDN